MLAPEKPVGQPHIGGDDADASGAHLKYLVAHEQIFQLVAECAHLGQHFSGFVYPACGEVVFEAADAVEVGVETPAGDGFYLVEHEFSVAKGIEHGRERA